ncbi:Uma2 family endonuclease [Spirulina subsalsa FACHB-351]|uniref:Uma2 family endonuclease n=1 Tax=Spirulina subsalsa FACHB-351 TaxID=234711 RepID=A0ABT3L351_9CYAN|nr:Uma2 family endonuclease [Spirulina subsalsa]MCW6035882.1 Uma2 family endonuclease [Spirulina subsalsa FACHB-351]
MTVSTLSQLEYPESDGQPLADNTLQFRLIVTLQGGLDALFQDNPNVFVAGDLLWYPVEGEPWTRVAPDVLVAIGRPKGDRGSYLQWREDNIPPQVVFEIASPSNTRQELEVTKHHFYQRYGVEEYYLFYPEQGELKGWLRSGAILAPIPTMDNWISPRLGIRFTVVEEQLVVYHPTGERFTSFVELVAQNQQIRQEAEQARLQAEQARLRAEQAEQAQLNAISQLLDRGMTVEQVAQVLSLPVERVANWRDRQN